MRMRENIPILGPSSGSAVVQVNPQKTINLYTKLEGPGAVSPITLRRTPGLTLIDNTETGGAGRSNGVRWNGKDYFVIGGRLVSIDDNDVLTAEGILLTTSGRVSIARGRSYLLIVDGTYGYAWDGATFTSNIRSSDADFPANPTHAIYMDGYFLVNDAGTDNFYRSDSEDPTSWDPLLFEVASASPDDILGLAEYDRDIYACGEDTIQRYFNQGGAGFNFAPYPNTIQLGLVAPYSLVSGPNGVTGLMQAESGGLGVYTLSGGQAIPESTADDAEEMQGLSGKSDAIGSLYTLNDITFYVLTFPGADVTKVFQLGRQLSHHQKSYGIGRWRVSGLGYSGSRILAVDYNSDNVYVLDKDAYTENGSALICERYTQIVHNRGLPFVCPRYEVLVQAGVGLISGQGSDPQLQLALSRDGGQTYTVHRSKGIGGIGQYQQQAVWRQLGGDFYKLSTWLRYSEPTEFAILGGNADIEF